MKIKNLSVLAGLGGSLILTGSATADYTGLKVVMKPNEFGISVANVYATFTGDLGDYIIAVAGTPIYPMRVTINKGTFYQHPEGTDRAPSGFLVNNAFPSLAYDSFVTIGKKRSAGDATSLSPGWPGFGPSNLPPLAFPGTNLGWFTHPAFPQGHPVDGQVLLGQFSTADGQGVSGSFRVSGFQGAGGTPFQVLAQFTVPTCPWDLDGSGDVGITDLLDLLAQWAPTPAARPTSTATGRWTSSTCCCCLPPGDRAHDSPFRRHHRPAPGQLNAALGADRRLAHRVTALGAEATPAADLSNGPGISNQAGLKNG